MPSLGENNQVTERKHMSHFLSKTILLGSYQSKFASTSFSVGQAVSDDVMLLYVSTNTIINIVTNMRYCWYQSH